MEEILPYPPRTPRYRRRRRHDTFLTNLRQPAARIKALLVGSWNAAAGDVGIPDGAIASLVERKYSARNWTERC